MGAGRSQQASGQRLSAGASEAHGTALKSETGLSRLPARRCAGWSPAEAAAEGPEPVPPRLLLGCIPPPFGETEACDL